MSSERKTAVVTGAARGIGLATARAFLAQGWRVAMIDIDEPQLRAAGDKLAAPDDTLAICCDVALPDQVGDAARQVDACFGRVDAVVNNAGVAVFKTMLDTTFEEWSRVLAVNLTGPFLVTQTFAPMMIAVGGGAVVNIGSISGVRASLLRVAYGTSKAGVSHLTRQQAAELAEYSIRVNAVAPGPVDTAMAKAVHTADIRADYHDAIPLNRYGLEDEIADAVLFLCSERASYINGQTLAVDGGFEATGIGLPSFRNRDRAP